MQFLLFLSIAWLVTSQAWAIYGPEFKTSSPGFHRRKPPKVAARDGYKLPGNARPLRYDLTLTLSPYDSRADGEVLITLDVDPSGKYQKTQTLQLNSGVILDGLTFLWNETMTCNLSEFGVAYIQITCPEPIEGNSQTLRITYSTSLAAFDEYGMYTFYYKENNAYQFMIATQFEQDYARTVFPCFDEPEYKAPIQLTLKTDTSTGYDFSHWIANTKVASETRENTVVRTTFETTPNMSAYLLAFVATSDFKNFSNTNLNADFDFEIFARPSTENYVSIALESGPKLIDLMGSFTGIPYKSLGNDKMVFAAIPEFALGAMENWGLITFREQILIDEGADRTTARDKQYAIEVIAHELTHQWFGDYVTLDWWSETWLNEGFARYFEYYLPNELSANFSMLKQFVVKEKQRALKADSSPNGIPLSNNASEVTTNTDLLAEFGDISYSKGASIVKILHETIGDDAFKKGLQTYLHNNNYSNPTAKILINTLQSVIPDSKLDLNQLFKEWIYKNGYPLLDISLGAKNKVSIQATKFCSSLDKTGENNTAYWWIPLTYTTSEHPDFDTINFEWTHSANISDTNITLPSTDKSWIIFNLQSTGYYRVNYDQTLWNRIITVLNNSKTFSTIDVLNRAQLLDDIFNVAKSYQTKEQNGTLYYSTAFKLIEYLQYETEYYPWYTFFTEMQYLMEVIQDAATLSALKEKILNIISPQVVIPKNTDKPSHTETLKRNLLLTWACKLGHEECTQWALKQFENYKQNTSRIDNNYRDVIVCTGLSLVNSSRTNFKIILGIMENSNLPYEQTDLIKALTCIDSDELVKELLLQTIDYIPDEAPFSRLYNDKIITTLYMSGFEKIKCALNFVLTYDNGINGYWQALQTPEYLFKQIASKIYNQKHIDMFNDYIKKYEKDAEYESRIQAAKEAIEIAKGNIEYLDTYNAVLKSVIVDSGDSPTIAPTTVVPPTPTPGSSHKISSNTLLGIIFAFLLKYIFC